MLMVALTVIGVMIYVAVRVGQVKSALDEAIREINQEVYPKEISIHFQHLLEQFEALDRYSTQSKIDRSPHLDLVSLPYTIPW